MKVAHLSEPAEERVIFRDGLGVRERRETSTGEVVEWFHLDPAFASAEIPLRERVTRLAKLQHVKFARILSLEPATKGRGPILVSSHAPGVRVADVLEMAGHGLIQFEPGVGLHVFREVLGALAVLHDSRNVSHGALGPERVVLAPTGRVVMVEHVLAQALDRLQRPRHQLWREWRIPTPPTPGQARFDMQTDLAQAGLLAFALLLGRPLNEEDYPHRLRGLLPLVQDRLGRSPASAIAADVTAFIERLAPLDSRRAFKNVREAQQDYEKLITGAATSMGATSARAKTVFAAVIAIGPAGAAAAAATPEPATPAATIPLSVSVATPSTRALQPEEAPEAEADIDIEALLALEAELEGGTAVAPDPPAAPPPTHVVAPAVAEDAVALPEPEPLAEMAIDAPPVDAPALDAIAQERASLERQFAELVASVAPADDAPVHLIPETPDTSEPLVDARVLWSSMPAADASESATQVEEPVTSWLPEPLQAPVVESDDEAPVPFADTTIFAELDAPVEDSTIVVADPLPSAAIDHVSAEWWKEALPWRDEPQANAAYDAAPDVEATSRPIDAADAVEAVETPVPAGVGEDVGYLSLDTIDAQADAVALAEDGERQTWPEPAAYPDAFAVAEAVDVPVAPIAETADAPLPTVDEEPAVALVEPDDVPETVDAAATVWADQPVLDDEPLTGDVTLAVDDHAGPVAAAMEDPASAIAFIASEESTAAVEFVAGTAADAVDEPFMYEESSIGGAEAMAPAGASRPFGDIEPILLQAGGNDEDMSERSPFGFQPVDDAPMAAAASLFAHDAGGGSHDWRTAFLGAAVEAVPTTDGFFGEASSLPSILDSTDDIRAEVELAADVVLESPAVVDAELELVPAVEDVHAEESRDLEDVAIVEEESPAVEASLVEDLEHIEAIPNVEVPVVVAEPATIVETELVAAADSAAAIDVDEPSCHVEPEVAFAVEPEVEADVALEATVLLLADDEPAIAAAPAGEEELADAVSGEAIAAFVVADQQALDDEPALAIEPLIEAAAVEGFELEAASQQALETIAEPAIDDAPAVEAIDEFAGGETAALIADSVAADAPSLFAGSDLAVDAVVDVAAVAGAELVIESEPELEALAEIALVDAAPAPELLEEVVVAEVADPMAESAAVDQQWLHVESEQAPEVFVEVAAEEPPLVTEPAPVSAPTAPAPVPAAEPAPNAPPDAPPAPVSEPPAEVSRPVDVPAMMPEHVPEVVIVDDGHDRNAWDHLPTESRARAAVLAAAAAKPAAAASKKKRRRSKRKKGSPEPVPPPVVAREAVPAVLAPVMFAPPEAAAAPVEAAALMPPLEVVPPASLTVAPMALSLTPPASRAPADTEGRGARPTSLLNREVPTWTPPSDFAEFRARASQPAPVETASAMAAPDNREADLPAVDLMAPGEFEAPHASARPVLVAPGLDEATPPASPTRGPQGAPPVQSAPDALRPVEHEIRAVGMPDMDDLQPRTGRASVTSMADAIGPSSASGRVHTTEQWAPPPMSASRARRGINWRRFIAASVLIALFQGAAFAAWWWVQPGVRGTLVVQTGKTGIEVLLDDKVVGRTPFREDVAPGRHRLKLREGGKVREMPVEISVGVVTTQAIDWPSSGAGTGHLQVTSNPAGAEIFIAGKSRGQAPQLIENLPAGDQVLMLRSEAGTVTATATVVPDETTPLEVKIFAGWILVDAPVEVNLLLNGRAKIGSSMDGQILLPPGPHRVQAVNEGLGIKQWLSVTVEPGAIKRVPFVVAPGTLTLQEEAEVFVDGASAGMTPGTIKIAPGTHEISVRQADGTERRQALTVRSGQRIEL